jgi:hypothetical protein
MGWRQPRTKQPCTRARDRRLTAPWRQPRARQPCTRARDHRLKHLGGSQETAVYSCETAMYDRQQKTICKMHEISNNTMFFSGQMCDSSLGTLSTISRVLEDQEVASPATINRHADGRIDRSTKKFQVPCRQVARWVAWKFLFPQLFPFNLDGVCASAFLSCILSGRRLSFRTAWCRPSQTQKVFCAS